MVQTMFIMCTHAGDDAERATIAFVMATAAQAADVAVTMGFQAEGVRMCAAGAAETVAAASFPPARQLLDAFLEAGGRMLVCAPCLMARGIDTNTGLIPEAVVVGAATFVQECTAADTVLTY